MAITTPPQGAPPPPAIGAFQTVEWDDAYGPDGGWVIRDMTPDEIAAAFPPPPPPTIEEQRAGMSVTMRQLLLGLKRDGWITEAEAQAWAARTALPASVEAVIAAMPAADQVEARITALTMSVAERLNPLLLTAAQAQMPQATPEEVDAALDAAFTTWATL